MGVFQVLLLLTGLAQQIFATPKPADAEVSGSISGGIPPLLTFKDGNVGVNFLGFKASAGLGGLLTGDATQGGLHAEAGTPFGQRAGAGLGGKVDGDGRSIGGLYAGATAGGGVGAAAGLDGTAGPGGSIGRSYAGAAAGGVGVGKTVVKERFGDVPPAGASFSGSLNIQKIAAPARIEVVKEVAPSRVEIEVEKPLAPPPAKKTYVERTVIPNYVEKTIQVPSYVEKTIRVPTTIEKRIRVPAAPTIIEKEVEVPVPTVFKTKEVVIQNEAPAPPPTAYFTKTKYYRRPWFHYRKRINFDNTPYYGGVVAGGTADTNVEASGNAGFNAAADSGAYGGFGYGYGYNPGYYGSQGAVTVRKQFNGNLIRDIFNIPIATLGAVSNLVGGIAGGTSGSVSVSKSYGAAVRK